MDSLPQASGGRSGDSTSSGAERDTRSASAKPARPGHTFVNRQLGDFLLLRRLGAGGMGEVYLAQQLSLKRYVALKVLRSDAMSDETARRRFAVEAEAAAKLTHSNIVQIYASGTHEGIHYMALEYVHGMNLRDYVAKKAPVSAGFALQVMEQVAAALHHAGESGVVHRDIKPDNILLTRKGEVKVGDFGLARLAVEKPVNLTQSGVTMGTPLYMSPEQVEGRTLDPRSDLYSLGATCYYMLAGHPPYQGETALAIAVQHIRRDPPPLESSRPDLPPALCQVVRKLMAKNPDERYQTGRQVMRDVQKLRAELGSLELEPVPAVESQRVGTESAKDEARSIFNRSRVINSLKGHTVRWFAASLFLALLVGGAYGYYHRAPDVSSNSASAAPAKPSPRWEDVPKKATAEAQYRFATWAGQDLDPEAAWLAVIHHWPSETDWVLVAQMELGKHHLMERQLDKADNLFGEMAQALDARTRLAGEVGKAMLLTYRDRPGESGISLWEHVRNATLWSEGRASGGAAALADRTLLSMILWTFERNYRDMGRDWDDDVRKWANHTLQLFRSKAGSRND